MKEDVFVEIKDDFKSFCNHNFIWKEKNYPSKRGYNSIVSLLLETANDPAIRGDNELVQKVVSVLDDLVESLYDVQKSEMEADDARGKAFELSK